MWLLLVYIFCRAYLKSVAKKLAEDVDNLKSSANSLGKVSLNDNYLWPHLTNFSCVDEWFMQLMILFLLCVSCLFIIYLLFLMYTSHLQQQKQEWQERRTLKRDKGELLDLQLQLKNELPQRRVCRSSCHTSPRSWLIWSRT